MDENGLDSGSGDNSVRPTESHPSESLPADEATAAVPGSDVPQEKAEVSEAADVTQPVGDEADLRAERLARIRAEVAAGTYETDEKIESAVERLLREIG